MAIAHERIQTARTPSVLKLTAHEQEEIARLRQMIACACTQSEVQATTEALKTWLSRHPEQKNRLEALFEQLYLIGESIREAHAEAETMGLSADEAARRERVFVLCKRVHAEDPFQTFDAARRPAREALEEWQADHPSDLQISYLREALETEENVASALNESLYP